MTPFPVLASVHALLVASTLALTSLAASAETTPRPGSHDNRVRVATWTEGQVYRIVTTLTRVTTVEFGEGETIRSIIAGDTVGFQFDGVPGGRAFAIKPTASGVATNITVYTNRRSYYFHVVEARETPHYVVQFRYPDAQVQPLRAVAADAPNANYAVSSQEEFTPTAIWDDGTFTYFRFLGGRIEQSHVGDIDRHFLLDNAALVTLHRVRLGMLLDAIDALYQQPIGVDAAQHYAALALVLACGDDHVVTLANLVHDRVLECRFKEPREPARRSS